jgi:hypothetical protein
MVSTYLPLSRCIHDKDQMMISQGPEAADILLCPVLSFRGSNPEIATDIWQIICLMW